MAKPPVKSKPGARNTKAGPAVNVRSRNVDGKKLVPVPAPKPKSKRTKWPEGLDYRVVMKATPSKTTEKAQDVSIRSINSGVAKNGLPTIAAVTRSKEPLTAAKPPQHKTVVRYIPGTKVNVWLSCSCENFCFQWEYALIQHGASSKIYSNGEPAIVTNPSNRPGCCPHLYMLLSRKSTLSTLRSLAGER